MHKPSHCQELLEALSEYLDGEATESVCAEIERHLAECPDCRIVVDTLNKTILLYRDQEEGFQLPREVQQRLYAALDIDEFLPPEIKGG